MGPRVLPIHRDDYTESCYMEALQEEINDLTSKETAQALREPIVHLSSPHTPLSDVPFSSASTLVTKTIIQEERPFPDEFHSYLNDMVFESNVTSPELEGEGEGDVKATPWTPVGNNSKQEHLSSGHVSLFAQHFFNDTVIPSSLSQEMTPQVIRGHSLATMDVTSHELPPSDFHVPNRFSRSYNAQDDPFAPSYVLARQRAKLYKYASISSARRLVADGLLLTPSITPKISLKVGKRTIQVKSTLKATPPSCPISPFLMSDISRVEKASTCAPTHTPLFESPTTKKGQKRKRWLSSKLKSMEIHEGGSDANFAIHKSKKLRTLKNARHSEDVEVFKYTKEEDGIILSHWNGCPPLPANILSTIQKDLVSRGFVVRSLPALKFRLREQFEEKRLQMDSKPAKQDSRRSREAKNSSRP
ncbi:hypothetical protein I307_01000 [Cryptococcus deuterogattii 99/473]|uniref:Uncharacterized protein n=1 Tax=Cryptococcus deuterogattii Ram5 TaxID=1296110 RepID=A0A0D0T9H4_9TREE|nr:hypothetical protein I313_00854 [Cryptococcus deuterogattii Ram5]KIY59332.1 hypothetical protein I307_01000 [Cryptococcus deuterogattii 99/473]